MSVVSDLAGRMEYVWLPGKSPKGYAHNEVYDRVFAYWRMFWDQVMKENGTDAKVPTDDFLRQDLVTAILLDNEVVGLHLYSFFNLRTQAARQGTYFEKHFNQEFIDKLGQRGAHYVMSMEYLTMNPRFRKREVGVSIASVLIGLGFETVKYLAADAAVGACRTDVKVNELAWTFGCESLVENVNLYNTPVDLVAGFRDRVHPCDDPVVAKCVESFWNKRQDLRSRVFEEKTLNAA